MPRNLAKLHRNTLRFLVWSCFVAIVWAIWQESAFAQSDVAQGDEGFWWPLFVNLLNAEGLMEVLSKPGYFWAAFVALNLIVFTETGLLIGFCLPGDSLLVVVGLICANEQSGWDMPLLLLTLSISAIIGDTVGYWIGYTSGPKIFNREKSLFFAKDHLLKAQAFYEKHGAVTIILARFMPFLRTFAPVVAGVGKMNYRQFLTYNVVGGVAWVFSMIFAGRYLPSVVNPLFRQLLDQPQFRIEQHIEKVVIVIVILSVLPMVFAWMRSKMKSVPQTVSESPHVSETALTV